MSNPTYSIAARPQELQVTACTGVLIGSMYRLVFDKNIEGLREFHRMGIPLDSALFYAVKNGSMLIIEELLNNLRVVPSESTLLTAMQRGLAIRNMFLARFTPTVNHLNSAVAGENFDTANLLLDRGLEPNSLTLANVKATGKRSEERHTFIDRMVNTIAIAYLQQPGSLRHLINYTTIAQFERATDRAGVLTQEQLDRLLSDSLAAAQPGHALSLIRRGASFQIPHLNIAGQHVEWKSDSNPKGRWIGVLRTVCEIAVEVGVLHQSAENVFPIIRPLVADLALSHNEEFLLLCDVVARACTQEVRSETHRYLVGEIGRKQRMNRGNPGYTLEDMNNLIEETTTIFAKRDCETSSDFSSRITP